MKLHIKKDDTVIVLSGKDKGKKGKVIFSVPSQGRVAVEGVNVVTRHQRASQSSPQGGIVKQEAPINSSNVMVVCGSCKKPTRIASKKLADGSHVRACKRCGENIDK